MSLQSMNMSLQYMSLQWMSQFLPLNGNIDNVIRRIFIRSHLFLLSCSQLLSAKLAFYVEILLHV